MAVAAIAAGIRVAALRHLRLCSAQAKSLAGFYESALGFRQLAVEHLSGAQSQERFGMSGRTLRITLGLGAQRVQLLQFVDRPGRPCPHGGIASDLMFQHFAIVVFDMAAAVARLARATGWRPISTGGPQQLPASSGGVVAFKFRDPEGHPLELLAFPADAMPTRWRHVSAHGLFLGIDHSAISVADSARSIAFYEALGLTVAKRSVNDDPAQARLDNLDKPLVEVTTMDLDQAPPHLELLAYRNSGLRVAPDLRVNDVAATCMVFEAYPPMPRWRERRTRLQNLVDPDGHHLAIEWAGSGPG